MAGVWQVPDRMKEVAVDRRLRDIEQAHHDKTRVVACAVAIEPGLMLLFLGQIGRIKENGQQVQ